MYKLVLLHIKHSQSKFPKFLILVLNSNINLLDLTSLGRLLQREAVSVIENFAKFTGKKPAVDPLFFDVFDTETAVFIGLFRLVN